jgi:nickel/cobalt exporter
MDKELLILCMTAASIGFVHTLFGPDHYLPFIVMSRARKWSLGKTGLITFLCGIGHIASSVILGIIGVIFGIAVMKLEALEAFRGNIAAWALIGFGLAYCIWGIRRAIRYAPHRHGHLHPHDGKHAHEHVHVGRHAHPHDREKGNITPWILFTIFVLGPCEPLIPLLMYPAAKKSMAGLFMVAAVFGVVTIATMLCIVIVMSLGINFLPLGKFERYTHALAGATIALSGMAIQFLGL